MDPNVAFGAFTYERDRTGTTSNPGRELDLAEISRWGRQDGVPCRNIPQLCTANAQFTLQELSIPPGLLSAGALRPRAAASHRARE